MSVLLTTIVIIAAIELIEYVVECIDWGEETLPPPDISSLLHTYYKPDVCDTKMIANCQEMLRQFFDEPADAQLYMRIEQKMAGMDNEQKKVLLHNIAVKACQAMNVSISEIRFDDIQSMGCYNPANDSITISNAYLCQDICNVEMVKTIFHELKHATQYKAIGRDGNVWGYSQEKLIDWVNNFQNYVRSDIDPEGYFTQPIEIDSFGFECSVVPKPGMNADSNINF